MHPTIVMMNRWQAQAFRWGECDCVTAVADWVQLQIGEDPAADLRLTYGSAGECQRVTRFFTDPMACIGPRMEACGLQRTEAPVQGDVALLMVPNMGVVRPHGGLCLGDGYWGLKVSEGAIVIAKPKVAAAWKVLT